MNKKYISQINIYPVKSLGGISLKEAKIESRGLQFDRRWMLVDSEGCFMTQRVLPEMALLQVGLSEGELKVSHKTKNTSSLSLSLSSCTEESLRVKVWDDTVKASAVSIEADEWFSSMLNKSCRLVYMPDNAERKVNEKYAHSGEIVSFADAFPFLLIGEESLKDLNSRLEEKLPMNRFRPNFVFSGGEAFEEDKWKRFRAGTATFNVVKPCSRCVITTTDQETGQRGKEPLNTLASYRNVDGKVMFGQNLTQESNGTIKVGDEIEVIS